MPTLLWQTYARLYDGLLGLHPYRDMLARVGALADCHERVVLDLGAGTGNVTNALIGLGAARVIAVDLSRNMLHRAETKLRPWVAEGTVHLVLNDAISAMASLPDGAIDRITAVNFVYVLEDREEFFRQARRVLTPDGFIIAAHTTRPGMGPILREQFLHGGVSSCLSPRLLAIGAIDLVIDLLARGGRYDFASVDVLTKEASAAGFLDTEYLGQCYGSPQGVNALLRISSRSSQDGAKAVQLPIQHAVAFSGGPSTPM